MAAIDKAARYKADAKSWGIWKSTRTQSVSLNIDWMPDEIENPDGEFVPFPNAEGNTVQGDIWLIGRNGDVNAKAIETLRDVLKFTSGNLKDFQDTDKWKPPRCQITVERDEWPKDSGTFKFKVAWVNNLDGSGGGSGRATKTQVDEVQELHGDAIMAALAGELPEQATPATGDAIPF